MSDNLVQNLVEQNNRQLKKELEVGSGVNRGWTPEIFVQQVRIEHTLSFNVPSSSDKEPPPTCGAATISSTG
jgi:hypothetical protein